MGVFARLLRRSKATEEASTAEAQADIRTAEPAAEEAGEAKGSTDAKAEVETEPQAEGRTEAGVAEPAGAQDADGVTATEAVEDAAEGVEIPKQQSADEAADREAGEGART
ncbi:hypothetical protein OOK27_48540 [Streptomyces canus]|uniref:hypothetical protein n=1 Tax=Streptomyces canus TaxID=58343 RepID=UPI00225C07DA|nr:hypothetical protein [Streptomyces canus]MCX5261888.1 hypothetical protein [Streptomyces canus]